MRAFKTMVYDTAHQRIEQIFAGKAPVAILIKD